MTPAELVVRHGEVPAAMLAASQQPRLALTIGEMAAETYVPRTRIRALVKEHGLPTWRGRRDGKVETLLPVSLAPVLQELYWGPLDRVIAQWVEAAR